MINKTLEHHKEFLKNDWISNMQDNKEPGGLLSPQASMEEHMLRRTPLPGRVITSGKHSSNKEYARGAYGSMRIISRDGDSTTFAVCFAINAEDILAGCTEIDRRVGFLIKMSVKPSWSLQYEVLDPFKSILLGKGNMHANTVEECVRKTMDSTLERWSKTHVSRGSAIWQTFSKFLEIICMLGFLGTVAYVAVEETLSMKWMLTCLAWIPLGLLLKHLTLVIGGVTPKEG